MKPPIMDVNGAPLIGGKPKLVEKMRPIVPFRLQDKDGSAECTPQVDLTPLEGYQITLLTFYCVTQPPEMFDQRRNEVLRAYTPWRQFIIDNKLERHFTFHDGVPVNQVGHG